MVIELLFWIASMVFKYFSVPNTPRVMTLPSVILILFHPFYILAVPVLY